MRIFRVSTKVSTADDVTGTPIGPEFTGRPIERVVGVFMTREAANEAAALISENSPVHVCSVAVVETAL